MPPPSAAAISDLAPLPVPVELFFKGADLGGLRQVVLKGAWER